MKKLRLIALILCFMMFTALVFSACENMDFSLSFIVDYTVYTTIQANRQTLEMPPDPEKEGYTFGGWFWDNNIWQKPFDAASLTNAQISADMRVYAKWIAGEVKPEPVYYDPGSMNVLYFGVEPDVYNGTMDKDGTRYFWRWNDLEMADVIAEALISKGYVLASTTNSGNIYTSPCVDVSTDIKTPDIFVVSVCDTRKTTVTTYKATADVAQTPVPQRLEDINVGTDYMFFGKKPDFYFGSISSNYAMSLEWKWFGVNLLSEICAVLEKNGYVAFDRLLSESAADNDEQITNTTRVTAGNGSTRRYVVEHYDDKGIKTVHLYMPDIPDSYYYYPKMFLGAAPDSLNGYMDSDSYVQIWEWNNADMSRQAGAALTQKGYRLTGKGSRSEPNAVFVGTLVETSSTREDTFTITYYDANRIATTTVYSLYALPSLSSLLEQKGPDYFGIKTDAYTASAEYSDTRICWMWEKVDKRKDIDAFLTKNGYDMLQEYTMVSDFYEDGDILTYAQYSVFGGAFVVTYIDGHRNSTLRIYYPSQPFVPALERLPVSPVMTEIMFFGVEPDIYNSMMAITMPSANLVISYVWQWNSNVSNEVLAKFVASGFTCISEIKLEELKGEVTVLVTMRSIEWGTFYVFASGSEGGFIQSVYSAPDLVAP